MDQAERFLRTVLDGVPTDMVRQLLVKAEEEKVTDGSDELLRMYLAERVANEQSSGVERAYVEQEKHRMKIDSGRNVCTAGDWVASVPGTDINNGSIQEFQRHVIAIILDAGGVDPEAFPVREDLVANLREIRQVVDRQADEEGLWSVPLMNEQPIAEAFLQQELRHLHKVIEDYTHFLEPT